MSGLPLKAKISAVGVVRDKDGNVRQEVKTTSVEETKEKK